MALTKVTRGEAITTAKMNELAQEATLKTGRSFVFPPMIWEVPNREAMLEFGLADFGETDGGIVILTDERAAYQLKPFKIVESGNNARHSWEIEENWELLTTWHVVDAIYGPGTQDYTRVTTLTNAAVGDFAAAVGGQLSIYKISPVIFHLRQSPPTVFSNWHLMGGTKELAYSPIGLNLANAGVEPSAPIWRQQLRDIQAAAIAAISNSQGLPYKSYCHGQRKIPCFSLAGGVRVQLGLPANSGAHGLWVNRVGAPLATLPDAPDKINYVRMFKEVEYYSRGESEVWVHCIASGSINWKQGGVLAGNMNTPSGPRFDFKTLNDTGVNYISREVKFAVTVNLQGNNRVWSWQDSTGLGAQDTLFPQNYGTGGLWKGQWNGGIFDVSATVAATNTNEITNVNYIVEYRVKCLINQTTMARHKTADVRRGRLPDIAIEVPGFTTPVGNTIEVGRVAFAAATGDLQGAFISKPAATIPIMPGELKYVWGFANSNPPQWAVVPYPIYKWTGAPVSNPDRWTRGDTTIGVDAPGNAMVFDLYVSRPMVSPPNPTYGSAMTVRIGIVRNNAFVPMTLLTIPTGQAGVRMATANLEQFVIMDNEPLYYQVVGSGEVSAVQVMAIPRRGFTAGDTTIPYDSRGAQFAFADDFNATVDFLADI